VRLFSHRAPAVPDHLICERRAARQ
jgi:hypothetical protein